MQQLFIGLDSIQEMLKRAKCRPPLDQTQHHSQQTRIDTEKYENTRLINTHQIQTFSNIMTQKTQIMLFTMS